MTLVDVVEIARAQLGVKESGGPNAGEPFKRYGLPGEQPLAWCARFCRWCFTQVGHKLPGNPYEIASVTNLQRALNDAGAWRTPQLYMPVRGDLILLNARGQSDTGVVGRHIGIVERLEADIVHSIEGNWGDRVARVARSLEDPTIWGYGRWPLDPNA